MRSEANRFLEALQETIDVARATGQRAEAYHLKAAGEKNWPKMAQAVAMVEAAHGEGLEISANMYAYTAGATGLTAALPPWVQAGGHDAMVARLKDTAIRARVLAEMRDPDVEWENLRLLAGSDERLILIEFHTPAPQPRTGPPQAEVARERGTPSEETLPALIVEDDSRVGAGYLPME